MLNTPVVLPKLAASRLKLMLISLLHIIQTNLSITNLLQTKSQYSAYYIDKKLLFLLAV